MEPGGALLTRPTNPIEAGMSVGGGGSVGAAVVGVGGTSTVGTSEAGAGVEVGSAMPGETMAQAVKARVRRNRNAARGGGTKNRIMM
jgi:hypothetical protein